MLTHLQVQNLAVIEHASVEFGTGLNVLTGETGAGKSIVVDALALLSGGRAASDLIRRGTDRLTVAGVFRPSGEGWREPLERAGVRVAEDEIVVRREVSRDGPNRVFIDDQPVTLRLLSEVAPHLMRIHAQREELGLVSAKFQRRLLDRSGGQGASNLLAATADAFASYRDLLQKSERMAGDQRSRLERIDLLLFQQREIDEAKLTAGEESSLRAERDLLRHSEAIRTALGSSLSGLLEEDGSAAERLAASEKALASITEWDPRALPWAQELEELRIRLQETSREIGSRLQEVDADPVRLDDVEDRLALLERLFRKYGESSEEILGYRRKIGGELEELTMDEEGREALEKQLDSQLESYRSLARDLSRARQRWAEALTVGVHRELADLAMGKAEFAVAMKTRPLSASPLRIAGQEVEFGAGGYDEVTFELTANPGEAKGPLSAVASGGELSRVYLALRLAAGAGGGDLVPSLVFDEIDSGVGGAEAAALGQKLRRLASSSQVFAVTHLPQVASQGHRHYRVRKTASGGRTRIEVEHLEAEARVEEIARMLAGKKITALSRSHAEELLAGVG